MSQIQANDGIDAALRQAPTNRFSEMETEDFIEIMFTELTNQDPFSPNDSAALLEQLNSIRSIESDVELTNKLESIVFQGQLSSASAMIGSAVAGRTADGQLVDGEVIAVLRQDQEISIQLDNGWAIPSRRGGALRCPLTLATRKTGNECCSTSSP